MAALYSYDNNDKSSCKQEPKFKNSNANILYRFHLISAKLSSSSSNSGNVGVLLIKFSAHLANIKDFFLLTGPRRTANFKRIPPPPIVFFQFQRKKPQILKKDVGSYGECRLIIN